MQRLSFTKRLRIMGVLGLGFLPSACSEDDPAPRGQLMIVLQTDMSLPKDVTNVRLQVLNSGTGEVRHDKTYKLAPNGDNPLPATLAVVDGDSGKPTAVEVRALGIRGSEVRIFTKTITTIPRNRLATLRVPIQWLCDGQVKEIDDGIYDTTCNEDDGPATCRAGLCESAAQEEKELPDYAPEDVFGGGQEPADDLGICFPTEQCFDSGFDVYPDEDCKVELTMPKGSQPNFGLAVGLPPNADGICGELGCYVPLDKSELFGWALLDEDEEKDGRVTVSAQLPLAICSPAVRKKYLSVRAASKCETKTPSTPTCGPWSEIEGSIPNLSNGDAPKGPAGPDGGVPDGGAPDVLDPDAGGVVSLPPGEYRVAGAGGRSSLDLNGTLQLQVVRSGAGVDSDSGVPLDDVAVEWTSDATTVAEVDGDGLVTGVGAGSATITASFGDQEKLFEVEVLLGQPVAFEVASFGSAFQTTIPDSVGVAADPCAKALQELSGGTQVVLPVGCVLSVGAQAVYADDSEQAIVENIEWSTTKAGVAEVADGKVTAIGEGETEIVGTFEGRELRVQVEVIAPALIAIEVAQVENAPSAQGINGATQLVAYGYFTDSEDRVDITELVAWSSDDETIVEFRDTDPSGLARGKLAGTATISAELDGVRLNSMFTVQEL